MGPPGCARGHIGPHARRPEPCEGSCGSVLARGRAEEDPLDLPGGAAAETQRGLEALAAELAGVERAAQLVERGVVLLADLLAGGLEQDQVARALERGGDAHERLTLADVEAVDAEHDGLPVLDALGY